MTTMTIAVTNRKGGVGKTSTVHSLAYGLSQQGQRVLMVDIDPQGNLSHWCDKGDAATLADVTKGSRSLGEIIQPVGEGVWLVPGSDALLLAESDIEHREAVPQTWLRRQLGTVRMERWDFVVFDCPPSLGGLTTSAMVASDGVLAPVEPTALGLEGLAELIERIGQARELAPGLALLGVLPTRFDGRKRLAREALAQLKEAFDGDVLEPIRENVALAEAPSHRQNIFEYSPRCHAAVDYTVLAKEVIRRGRS